MSHTIRCLRCYKTVAYDNESHLDAHGWPCQDDISLTFVVLIVAFIIIPFCLTLLIWWRR